MDPLAIETKRLAEGSEGARASLQWEHSFLKERSCERGSGFFHPL